MCSYHLSFKFTIRGCKGLSSCQPGDRAAGAPTQERLACSSSSFLDSIGHSSFQMQGFCCDLRLISFRWDYYHALRISYLGIAAGSHRCCLTACSRSTVCPCSLLHLLPTCMQHLRHGASLTGGGGRCFLRWKKRLRQHIHCDKPWGCSSHKQP